MKVRDLDDIDYRILEAMQEDATLTGEDLSDRVRLSPAACRRRLQRLRDEKIIEREVAVLSPEVLGRPMSMVVLVTLERERSDVIDAFTRSVQKAREVMQCWYVTGSADFVLILSVTDMDHYEQFTKRFFFDNPNVRRFETMVSMRRVKFETAQPIRKR